MQTTLSNTIINSTVTFDDDSDDNAYESREDIEIESINNSNDDSVDHPKIYYLVNYLKSSRMDQ